MGGVEGNTSLPRCSERPSAREKACFLASEVVLPLPTKNLQYGTHLWDRLCAHCTYIYSLAYSQQFGLLSVAGQYRASYLVHMTAREPSLLYTVHDT